MNHASKHSDSIKEYMSLVKNVAFCYIILALIAGVAVKYIRDHCRDVKAEKIKFLDARGYITTDKGVRYFTDCLDDRLFVITHAGHGMVAAGPLGDCDG